MMMTMHYNLLKILNVKTNLNTIIDDQGDP